MRWRAYANTPSEYLGANRLAVHTCIDGQHVVQRIGNRRAKPCTPRELVARIRAIPRRTQRNGTADSDVSALASGNLAMWPDQRRAEWHGQLVPLTSTEFSLLEVLLRFVGTPVSKNDLSLRALGRRHSRHDRSIDVHISSIRRKLGNAADGRPLIQAVHQQGYQLLRE